MLSLLKERCYSNMKISEIRETDDATLRERLNTLWREIFNLRVQKVTEQKAPMHMFKKMRREIARIKTVLRERAMESNPNE